MYETIKVLERKILTLENKANLAEINSIAIQTDKMLSCYKCDYMASDVYEFDAHRWSEHKEDEIDNDYDYVEEVQQADQRKIEHTSRKCDENFVCNVYDKYFLRKSDVMKHKKKEHREQVAICRGYSKGMCLFGDEHCWFNHLETVQNFTRIDCNFCDKDFETRCDFLKHKKKEHKQFVPTCRNDENGNCFYNEYCWFVHKNDHKEKNEEENNSKEVFDKIFGMMDEIKQRLNHVENESK